MIADHVQPFVASVYTFFLMAATAGYERVISG